MTTTSTMTTTTTTGRNGAKIRNLQTTRFRVALSAGQRERLRDWTIFSLHYLPLFCSVDASSFRRGLLASHNLNSSSTVEPVNAGRPAPLTEYAAHILGLLSTQTRGSGWLSVSLSTAQPSQLAAPLERCGSAGRGRNHSWTKVIVIDSACQSTVLGERNGEPRR